jgi:hypothetical protein
MNNEVTNAIIESYRIRYNQLLKGSKELYKGELQVIKQLLDKVG